MRANLRLEFIAIKKERQAVVVSFGDDFDATSSNQALETFEDFGRVFFGLIDESSGD